MKAAVLIAAGFGLALAAGTPEGDLHPHILPIVVLDSGQAASREPIQVIPLPGHTRLNPGIISADSIRYRIQKGHLYLQPRDLIADTGNAKSGRIRDRKTIANFKRYWKKVETSDGYSKFRDQVLAGADVYKTRLPELLYFDSSLAVIPGYVFLRFR